MFKILSGSKRIKPKRRLPRAIVFTTALMFSPTFLILPLQAQENAMTVSKQDQSSVLKVQAALSTAVLKKDRKAAATTMADTFQAIGHVGNIVGKETYLDVHFSPERDFTTFEGSDQTVLKAGNAFVLVGKFKVVNAKSSDGMRIYTMSATFAPDDNGDLKIVSWQETPITNEDF